jgi:hypothetical protein
LRGSDRNPVQEKNQPLKRFFVEDAAFDQTEPAGFVNALREVVVNRSVGGHFGAALGTSPVFGGVEKRGTYSLATMILVNKPTLDIANRKPFVAAVGTRAQIGFQKTDESAILLLRNKNENRIDALRPAVQDSAKFSFVMRGRRLGPKADAQRSECSNVGRYSEPDVDRVSG